MIPSGPSVDEDKLAEEIKSYLDKNKNDGVDYKQRVFELWPSPDDDSLPEIKRFSSQFSKVFEYADKITGDNGENFPEDLVSQYDDCLVRVESIINSDDAFWSRIREAVLPLYDRLRDNPGATDHEKALHEEWTQKRWRGVRIFYDPIGMEVKTTKKMRGKDSQKVYCEEVISRRIIPAGLVIDLDGVGLSTIQKS